MRTSGHGGPGRPSRGRGSAAEGRPAGPEAGSWAGGEHPPDCHMLWSAIQRGPGPHARAPPVYAMAFDTPWLFCSREKGLCVGPEFNGGK